MNYYNNFMQYPYGYQANMQRQGQMANMSMPQQMQAQQPIQYETPTQFVGYANLKEVEAHILFPNTKAVFYDKTNNVYYEKACNNEGQSFIRKFEQVVSKGENQALETQKEQPAIDLSAFVKKEELGAFVGLDEYNKLLTKVENLQKQLGANKNVLQKPTT